MGQENQTVQNFELQGFRIIQENFLSTYKPLLEE